MQLIQNKPQVIPITYDTIADGKGFSDVVEAVFSLQLTPSDTDGQYLLKRLSDGGISYDSSNRIWNVNIEQADFATLLPNDGYTPIFAIKYAGDTEFRPIELAEKNALKTSLKVSVKASWLEIQA